MPEGTAGPAGQSRGQGPGCILESRYKSVAVLDEESLLTVGVYIDLNPVAAGISAVPETSEYTSISTRVEHVEAQGQTDRLEAAVQGSVAGSLAAGGLEESLWLCPIEDRRQIDSSREGMFDGLSLGNYLLVVDYTARLFRTGKARISVELAGIFDRLGSRADNWQIRMEKLRRGRLFGRFLAGKRPVIPVLPRRVSCLAGPLPQTQEPAHGTPERPRARLRLAAAYPTTGFKRLVDG